METDLLEPLATVADINQLWTEIMLSKKIGDQVKVNSLVARQPDDREGFLSEIAFLKVNYSRGNGQQIDVHLVLKVLPRDSELKQFMANGCLAQREVGFYKFISIQKFTDICKKIGIDLPVPEIYFVAHNAEAISIILQDLCVNGYKSMIVKEGSNLHQTKVALHAVAQIHAAGLLYIRKYGEADENLGSLSLPFQFEFYDQFLIPNIKTLATMMEKTPFFQTLKSLEPFCRQMLYMSKQYPLIKTIIHGDLWSGQLLYAEDESKAEIIDWQFCRIDNPATDILSMLFMSCDPKVLESHLDELLNCYWMSFTGPLDAAGIMLDVNFDQFKANIEDLLIYGFAFLVISLHDFIDGNNISEGRIHGVIQLLDRRGVFERFLGKK